MICSPKPTTWTLDWTHPVTGKTVAIAIRHTRDYLVVGSDHIEIESVKPKRAPLPITETGYRSHFLDRQELRSAGGPLQFVKSWLLREERSKEWVKRDHAARQTDLFQWADANAEIGRRKSSKPAKRPASKPRKRRAPTAKIG
jgi:hypothetical protein